MTLGIPRLKEILMTTPTNIKTPFMTVYFNKDKTYSKDQMQKIAKHFEKLQLTEVVKDLKLSQALAKGNDGNFKRVYKLIEKSLFSENSKNLNEIFFSAITQGGFKNRNFFSSVCPSVCPAHARSSAMGQLLALKFYMHIC